MHSTIVESEYCLVALVLVNKHNGNFHEENFNDDISRGSCEEYGIELG